jgi:hypothetical protein
VADGTTSTSEVGIAAVLSFTLVDIIKVFQFAFIPTSLYALYNTVPEGVTVGVGVGETLGVGVGETVGVGLGLGVGVGVGVGVTFTNFHA